MNQSKIVSFLLKDRPWYVALPSFFILFLIIISPFLWKKNEQKINLFFDRTQQSIIQEKYAFYAWKMDEHERLLKSCQEHTFGYLYVPRNKWNCPVCMSHSNLDLITPDFIFDLLKGVL